MVKVFYEHGNYKIQDIVLSDRICWWVMDGLSVEQEMGRKEIQTMRKGLILFKLLLNFIVLAFFIFRPVIYTKCLFEI